jgi:polyisoprenyl-phosphate glycosyltransferase
MLDKNLEKICRQNPVVAKEIALAILHSTLNNNANGDSHKETDELIKLISIALKAAPDSSSVDVSIVLPVFDEEENIPEIYRRLTETLSPKFSYEILFVNDGSSDKSSELIQRLNETDSRAKLINLSRNFGHQAAITAGIDYSQGQAVILMDADLQDPPEVLLQMIDTWKQGNDVVFAVRKKRKEFFLKRAAYFSFYRLLKVISNVDIPLDSGDFCLMDRKVVDRIKALPEKNRFLRGLRSWVGFKQVAFPYERDARYAGEVKYTFRKLIKLGLDGIVSFSSFPLRLATYFGFSTCFLSAIYLVFAIIMHFIGNPPPGWTSIIGVVLLIGGIQLIILGIIGEYIARIYEESKQRPVYIVSSVIS